MLWVEVWLCGDHVATLYLNYVIRYTYLLRILLGMGFGEDYLWAIGLLYNAQQELPTLFVQTTQVQLTLAQERGNKCICSHGIT